MYIVYSTAGRTQSCHPTLARPQSPASPPNSAWHLSSSASWLRTELCQGPLYIGQVPAIGATSVLWSSCQGDRCGTSWQSHRQMGLELMVFHTDIQPLENGERWFKNCEPQTNFLNNLKMKRKIEMLHLDKFDVVCSLVAMLLYINTISHQFTYDDR